MARSKNRRRKNNRGLLKTTALVTGMIAIPLVALGGGGILAYRYLNTEQIDANFCYPRNDQEQTALFVDYSLTHQTSTSQKRDLRNSLVEAYEGMQPNGQLSVFTTENGSTATINTPVFTLCKPAETSREQDAIGAPVSSGPKLARTYAEAHDRFETFVDQLMVQSQDQAHLAATSPILEQVQGISRYDFSAPLSRLIMYSDGINNSRAGQFCQKQGELPRFEVFAQRPDYRFIAPDDLRGATVDIRLVEFGTLPQDGLSFCTNDELRTFWIDLFEANGAGAVRLTPLSYGAGQ